MLSQPPALGATPTAVQALLYVNQLTRYTTQQQALKDAKTQLLAALNEEALSLIVEPRHDTRRRTIRAIMDILREAYGTLTAADLVQQKHLLLELYPPATPIREYIRKQRNVRTVCAAADQPMTEADKVHALRQGMKHIPVMATTVQHFVTTHPTVAAQRFELLATLLGQAEDNGEPEPSTGTTGYAAAATTLDPPVTMAILEQRLKEFAVELQRNTPPSGQIQPPRQYCWTHGPCGQSFKDCNRPAPNHGDCQQPTRGYPSESLWKKVTGRRCCAHKYMFCNS
jgi:hypothetical protein